MGLSVGEVGFLLIHLCQETLGHTIRLEASLRYIICGVSGLQQTFPVLSFGSLDRNPEWTVIGSAGRGPKHPHTTPPKRELFPARPPPSRPASPGGRHPPPRG